jgi:hypothetical protein
MARKKKRPTRKKARKTTGGLKSKILRRIRAEARRKGRGGRASNYYAKDPATKPGGGYSKGSFVKSDPSRRRKPSRRKKTRPRARRRRAGDR